MRRAVCVIVTAVVIGSFGATWAGADYTECLIVNVDSLDLRVLPDPAASIVPGEPLERGEPVTIVESKGSWAKITFEGAKAPGWVRQRQLIMADPEKIRTERSQRRRGLGRLFQGNDQSGYGSAAAARGLSSLGKTMQKEQVFSARDAKQADIVTEYRITGVPAVPKRAERAVVLRQKLNAFLREGALGDYLP